MGELPTVFAVVSVEGVGELFFVLDFPLRLTHANTAYINNFMKTCSNY